MTVVELLIYITIAFVLQVAIFGAVAFRRHWGIYQDMRHRMVGFDTDIIGEADLSRPELDHPPSQEAHWKGFRNFRVSKKIFEDRNKNVCSFYLMPTDDEPLADFQPGQFLTFQLNIDDPSGEGRKPIVRCYSLSESPGHDHYRISVKRVPAPAGSTDLPPGLSSNHLHDHVQEGDVLAVRAPGGHFFLQPGNGPIVLIGGGIGITPMISMLNAALSTGSKREMWLFYGVRNSTEHVMKDHLAALARDHDNFRLHVCYSSPQPGDVEGVDYHHRGHVDLTLLRQTLSLKPYQFYICGPSAMMEALVPALYDWGVPKQNVFYEAFGPASLIKSQPQDTLSPHEITSSLPVSVTFAKSGKTVTWDGSSASLLEFAEDNGIEVASGCRAGGCGSCQVSIDEGEVEYPQPPDFDPDLGCCLMCVSRPTRNLTLQA
ncbi:2Fe-2S iron-sulfur cluster-binding protein [Magnetovibrio blakemorei]|uniref:nitric oxide dioxygenase n=1 Tax=Magnetovibrio blakemorei TaxID=28181 RepID=A0A1E5QB79_9PROT|nr:2Fe-2S iron-sulfur cluster-binding protein [Magnetovibrio blakemorei]OEJ69285.1 hypothetical protein BEN30_04185 [Magnetovibrio blakemorei]